MNETPHHNLLLEEIQIRRSSKLYDPEKHLDSATVHSLMEAARWAPSSGNGQPWRYILFPKDDLELFSIGLSLLNEDNQTWARYAALLILSIAQEIRPNGKFNAKALHDLGLANQNILLQAVHLGLNCRPMGGFDADRAIMTLGIPDGYKPVAMIAVGYQGHSKDLPDDIIRGDSMPRKRNSIEDFVFSGKWNVRMNSGGLL